VIIMPTSRRHWVAAGPGSHAALFNKAEVKTSTAMGGTPEQMLTADVKAEEEAITLYKEIIRQGDIRGR
jgi:hypothetical protein